MKKQTKPMSKKLLAERKANILLEVFYAKYPKLLKLDYYQDMDLYNSLMAAWLSGYERGTKRYRDSVTKKPARKRNV